MNNIAVAVACYNNEAEVISFANQLKEQTWVDRIQLVVTCNAVGNYESFKSAILDVLPSAAVFNPGINLGYLSGCLYGIEQMNKSFSWVMISNTDIVFVQKDFFEKALQNVPENVWCIGPRITLVGTENHQNPFLKERPKSLKVKVWRIVYSLYPLFWLYFKLSYLKNDKTSISGIDSQIVYAVHGSCFIVSNSCIEALNEEKSNIFMYCEELMVAEIVRERDKRCYYNSEIGIIHNENQVTGKIGDRKKQQWFKSSMTYLYNRFYK